jgi:hypothetical protein
MRAGEVLLRVARPKITMVLQNIELRRRAVYLFYAKSAAKLTSSLWNVFCEP